MNNSRLNRNLEKQSKKQIISSGIAIVIIIVFLAKFGLPIVGGISGFFISLNEKKETANGQGNFTEKLQTPILDPLPQATNSATLKISGRASTDGTIQVYVNNSNSKEIDIKEDKTFEDTIDNLKEGDNAIKIRMERHDKTSDFTDEKIVTFTKKEPKIEISYPSDQQEFKHGDDQLTVKGKTDPIDNTVTINGFRAIVDENGNFSYFMKLPEGETKLKIEAKTQAGVSTEKEITVRYSP